MHAIEHTPAQIWLSDDMFIKHVESKVAEVQIVVGCIRAQLNRAVELYLAGIWGSLGETENQG